MAKVIIGDTEYQVKWTLGSFIKFQEETGLNPFEGNVLQDLDPLKLRALLYSIVVGDINVNDINDLELSELMELVQALQETMPNTSAKKK